MRKWEHPPWKEHLFKASTLQMQQQSTVGLAPGRSQTQQGPRNEGLRQEAPPLCNGGQRQLHEDRDRQACCDP